MKNIWNQFRYQQNWFNGRCGRYIFVLIIFGIFISYTIVVTSKESSKKPWNSSDQSVDDKAWDITTDNPEKVFSSILQGQSGDWYRVGISTKANHAARIDVFLYSVFNDDVLVGSLNITASDDFQYREIIFPVPPGMFSDVRFVLHKEDSSEWVYTGVKLSEFVLSRLNVKNNFEATRLAPTLAGNIKHDIEVLSLNNQVVTSKNKFEGYFIAEADFIESIQLNVQEKIKNKSYILELYEVVKNEAGEATVLIKKLALNSQELEARKDEWGNQRILFPAHLERGKGYLLMFTGAKNTSRGPTLPFLGELSETINNGKGLVAMTLGRYARVEDDVLLSGARVEDFGKEVIYSYSLSGEVDDYFDLYNIEGKVAFDGKKGIITGKQKQNTSFTYRFFTVHPFERFLLAARQAGGTGQEVKLEYSYDNAFWQEVLPVQINKSHTFSLKLTGSGKERVIYVRVSYSGEDKKTGSFGLDQLSVRAELKRK